jgi:hypothetical protein
VRGMLSLIVVSAVVTAACGTTHRQLQSAVVVTGNGSFRVAAEPAGGTEHPAMGAQFGGLLGGALWPGWDTVLGLGRCDLSAYRTKGERLGAERHDAAADAGRGMAPR